MDTIRTVSHEDHGLFISKDDLIAVLTERLNKFPEEIEKLKLPQVSSIVGADGKPTIIPSDSLEVARHEGRQTMLEGVLLLINQ